MKICAIHQPNFMPWLGYFYKIAKCDSFVVLDNVDFQQGNANSITNRTKIKCNGEEKLITIAVKKNSQSKLIKDIVIDKQSTQINKVLKTIGFNYAKSEFYKETFPLLENIVLEAYQSDFLSEFNTTIISEIANLLEIRTNMINASSIENLSEDRNLRIIEICKSQEAEIYFSGNGGKKYHQEKIFLDNNITIKYTDFKPIEYKQVGLAFIGGLSIIDVLLNCGIEKTTIRYVSAASREFELEIYPQKSNTKIEAITRSQRLSKFNFYIYSKIY